MKPIEFITSNYSLFGARGVWLAALARLRQKPEEVAVAVPGIKHPVHLRLRTSDVSTFRQVLVAAGYACDFAKSPRTIVDAGANIGLTSVFYANRYPDAQIVAIEPEESNFRLLRKNAAPYPKIIPLQGALWRNDEELSVVDSGLGDWGFQTTADATSQHIVNRSQAKIRGMTIDMLIKTHRLDYIDLLKVDIEGSEKEVFENASTWIKSVGAIAIELHDEIRPGCSRAFSDAAKSFERVCTRGETLFVARPGNVSGASSSMRKGENGFAEPTLKLPCKITQAANS